MNSVNTVIKGEVNYIINAIAYWSRKKQYHIDNPYNDEYLDKKSIKVIDAHISKHRHRLDKILNTIIIDNANNN